MFAICSKFANLRHKRSYRVKLLVAFLVNDDVANDVGEDAELNESAEKLKGQNIRSYFCRD